jgi:cytochrome c
MNILDNLVIPLSPEHLKLLHYIAILISFLFIPFISLIIGGTFISLYFELKGIKKGNAMHLEFAKDVIKIATVNKSMSIMLGILSLFTSILIYVQLFHSADFATVNYLTGAFIFVSIGFVLIYTYRYLLNLNDIFHSIKRIDLSDKKVLDKISNFETKSKKLSSKSGKLGLIFILIGCWLFVAGITVSFMSPTWGNSNMIEILFSEHVISNFMTFLLMAFAFTGATLMFAFFYWEGGRKDLSDDYKNYIKKICIYLTFGGTVLLPLFFLINLVSIPNNGLSYSVFAFTTVALLLIFLGFLYLYAMYKNSDTKYSGQLFFVFLFAILALIIKDQMAIENATQIQTEILATNFENDMAKLTGENTTPKISGEDIYKNICSACHSFDHKIVGPPYKLTLPKYHDDVDKLVKFILNPTQNNPGYPPMPNPGLRPDQARAVATYILKEVKKYE